MKQNGTFARIFAVLGIGLLFGCGPSNPPTYKVSGVVSLDGKPVPGATIAFIPDTGTEAQPAAAISDNEGKYSLTTFASGDGAMKGMYLVTVMKVQTEAGQSPYDAYKEPEKKEEPTSGKEQTLEDMYSAYGNAYSGPPEGAGQGRQPASKDLLPVKYKTKESSGLRHVVSDSGTNTINLELVSK
ncbi:MAG: hypothetical protein MUC83_09905 [Pirellula sp.]|jgi:hypothetical protein|nr:hypothetical protein [Pirellula sp.]